MIITLINIPASQRVHWKERSLCPVPHVPHPVSLPQWVPLAVPSLRLLLSVSFSAGIFLRESLERNTTLGNDAGSSAGTCHPLCCRGHNKGGLRRATCRSLNGCLCRHLWHRCAGGTVPRLPPRWRSHLQLTTHFSPS